MSIQTIAPALFGDSGQMFETADSLRAGLGDIDGDGDLDAVFANDVVANSVYVNGGTGLFTDTGQALDNTNSFGIALGDVDGDGDGDGDGDLDIFFANQLLPDRIYANNGVGIYTDTGQP